MNYSYDNKIDRHGTSSIKWDTLALQHPGKDLLPFWIADMDIETAPEVKEALRQRAEHGIYGYTFRREGFYESIMHWYESRHQWQIQRQWVIGSPGVLTSLAIFLNRLTEPGSNVMTLAPAYHGFYEIVKNSGRTMITSDLLLKDGFFAMDYEDIEEKLITHQCKVFIFCNPHNPSGRVWTKEEMGKLLEICNRHQVLILSDDIHCDIVYSGHKYIPLASLKEADMDRIITCGSPGKTFSLTGMGSSFVIASNPEFQKILEEELLKQKLSEGNIFGNVALEAAYSKGSAWTDGLCLYLESNRNQVAAFIKENQLPVKAIVPEGTFMMLLDFNEIGGSFQEIKKRLLNDIGLKMNPGETFGDITKGYARFNFAVPTALLDKGLERLKKLG